MSNRFNLKDLQSAYNNLLCEAKIDDALEKTDYDDLDKEMIKKFNNRLSNKSRYVNYIIKNFNAYGLDDLSYFDRYQQAFPGVDFDKITYDELHEMVTMHQHKKELEKIHPEAEKIFEDEDVLIVSPLTYKAAVYHGKGTNWCISTSNDSFWNRYTDNFEKFYFLISKKHPITHRFSKVAVQIKLNGSINEFRDREDEEIIKSDINIYDFNKYIQYLKPMEMTLDITINKMDLKYNEKTGLYDCDFGLSIKNDSPLIKDGKFVIKFGHVKGDFSCSRCYTLKSLEGCPVVVGGNFDCSTTNITSLVGSPKSVIGDFNCSGCSYLTSLEGAPEIVGNIFECSYCNHLTSLKGCSKFLYTLSCRGCNLIKSFEGISDDVKMIRVSDCDGLQSLEGLPEEMLAVEITDCKNLISLEGSPKYVKYNFVIINTGIDSLEGCPQKVGSDFRVYHNKRRFDVDDVKEVCEVAGDTML